MRIAVDAMGGDNAPRDIVAGAIQAAEQLPDLERIYLVGRRADIEAVCRELDRRSLQVRRRDGSRVLSQKETP